MVARTVISLLLLAQVLGTACAQVGAGWLVHAKGGDEVAKSRRVVHGGSWSAYVKATGGNNSPGLLQWVRADRYRGKRVRLSAYLKTKVAGVTEPNKDGEQSGVHLFFYADGRTQRLSSADTSGERPKGTVDWRKYEFVIDVPEEAVLLQFGLELFGPGQLWLDDVELNVVGKEVPTSKPPTSGSGAVREFTGGPKDRNVVGLLSLDPSERPVNLDFELGPVVEAHDEPEAPSSEPVPAPEFTLQTKRIGRSEFRDKVVVVHFPTGGLVGSGQVMWLETLQDKYGPKGMAVVLIYITSEVAKTFPFRGMGAVLEGAKCIKLADEKELPSEDNASARWFAASRFKVTELPTTILINREWQIVRKFDGLVPRGALEQAIETLLK
jgi:hypothetical protein